MLNFANVLAVDFCSQVPEGVFGVVGLIISGIQIVVPILLIIWGMIDFAKAITKSDEDEIKKGQKTFIKRLIAAAIVFLVVTIVRLVVQLVGQVGADGFNQSIWSCVQAFINGGR